MEAGNDVFDVRNWKPPTRSEYADYSGRFQTTDSATSGQKTSRRIQVRELAERFKPVDLYCYFKQKIGRPNGIVMIEEVFGPPSSDDLYHWQYVLKSANFFAEFQSTQTGLTLIIYDADPLTEEDWKSVDDTLARELQSHRAAIGKARNQLEDWTVFVNPFKRLDEVIGTLEYRASSIRLQEPAMPWLAMGSGGANEKQRQTFLEEAKAYHEALVEAQLVGLAIRNNVPIWVEAFVNLVFFTLAKPRFKSDRRLFDSLSRQHIDVRVKMLSESCEGFSGHVRDKDEPFRAMQSLFGNRNTALHGAVDLKSLTTDRVYFDGRRPIYNEWKPDYLRQIPKTISFIEPEAAREDIETGSEFIIYLANLLNDSVRESFWHIANTPLLGYRKDKKRVGVLFPSTIRFPIVGPLENEAQPD